MLRISILHIVGCCNGVVCIRKKDCFFLWNPATRISIKLPETDLEIYVVSKCGFGWDAASGAYKVFISDYKPLGQIYSSKTNSWTTVGMQKHLAVCDESGQFVCGKIHWPTMSNNIYSLDLNSEVFEVIEHPCDPELGRQLWLGEINGCLSFVCDDNKKTRLGFWIMKESWLKLLTVPLVFPYRDRAFSALFEIVPEGVVLLIYGSACVVFNRDDTVLSSSPMKVNRCYEMWQNRITYHYDTHFYVESLVSPVPAYTDLSFV